ncbi:MAG: hypothetical protein LYZ70_01335 [Nitrososphaerales archaeon]|nr:hypothetical protein [Nitrososphaerales archaeon]
MLRFHFHQIELADRFYVPMPKMTRRQVAIIRGRLKALGFKTLQSTTLGATKNGTRIDVNPVGFCRSNRDMSDVIAPVVPEILACEQELVSLLALQRVYFASQRHANEFSLRLTPRLESGPLWEELRAAGACALMPDEQVVYSSLLSSSRNSFAVVTDFPTSGCVVRRIGRRQYYDSALGPTELASTLRGLESHGQRNTYLPRDALVRLRSSALPPKALRDLFGGLGEWCFLSVARTRQKL